MLLAVLLIASALALTQDQEKKINDMISNVGKKLTEVGDSIKNHSEEINTIMEEVKKSSSFEGSQVKLEELEAKIMKVVRGPEPFSEPPKGDKLIDLKQMYEQTEKRFKENVNKIQKEKDSKKVKEAKKEVKEAVKKVEKKDDKKEEFKLKDDIEPPKVHTAKPLGTPGKVVPPKKEEVKKEVKKTAKKEVKKEAKKEVKKAIKKETKKIVKKAIVADTDAKALDMIKTDILPPTLGVRPYVPMINVYNPMMYMGRPFMAQSPYMMAMRRPIYPSMGYTYTYPPVNYLGMKYPTLCHQGYGIPTHRFYGPYRRPYYNRFNTHAYSNEYMLRPEYYETFNNKDPYMAKDIPRTVF
ncbi:hypothetical protein EIN_411070 [Entamoeba invadens IP1]|uniref:Uncharacterized protein n=2 Tax=Entamoeba invadens TaxID=33085 RepID=A0A0A1U707_ENTIV|nr:hypothetical protein EIN_411070 [Entamoeba invadens IP1]ELP87754.1 hypothetical protein EIN_411070 [Entamoeba invadens IP1]BAN40197.1 hypothetical protein, conserved [Entamoeba invadens]BAN40887.1 hypothetical protein, conserved [Entamoeba invadens]BAN42479.1 hypothetical protein, conserved [Entamoeba invadens]|eukprot:XP_004254525.1 hypothetical protein EIN_411070 [Entamoeba invadens IP1]